MHYLNELKTNKGNSRKTSAWVVSMGKQGTFHATGKYSCNLKLSSYPIIQPPFEQKPLQQILLQPHPKKVTRKQHCWAMSGLKLLSKNPLLVLKNFTANQHRRISQFLQNFFSKWSHPRVRMSFFEWSFKYLLFQHQWVTKGSRLAIPGRDAGPRCGWLTVLSRSLTPGTTPCHLHWWTNCRFQGVH